MKRLALALLLVAPSWAQPRAEVPVQITLTSGALEIYSDYRDLRFAELVLDGNERYTVAVQGPTLTILDATGTGTGWRIYLQSGDFIGESGQRIGVANFSFRAQGGSLVRLEGMPLSPQGPLETGVAAPLNSPLLCVVSAAGSGMGSYQWRPLPSSFSLTVPAQALAGSYQATVTVTVVRGYP